MNTDLSDGWVMFVFNKQGQVDINQLTGVGLGEPPVQ